MTTTNKETTMKVTAQELVDNAEPDKDLLGRPMKYAIVETVKNGRTAHPRVADGYRIVAWAKSEKLAYARCEPANPSSFHGLMHRQVIRKTSRFCD